MTRYDQLGAVRWRIEDVAVMRHLRLVGTIPRGILRRSTVQAVEHYRVQVFKFTFLRDFASFILIYLVLRLKIRQSVYGQV